MNLPFERKCPIILPAQGQFVTILIRYIHERYFHANRLFLLTYFSTKFVFVGGLSRTIKKVLYKCVDCRHYLFQSQLVCRPS